MTIAIALKCEDGIILATDTQYSVGCGVALKIAGEKLFTLKPRADLSVCVAGAGSVPYIKMTVETLNLRLRKDLSGDPMATIYRVRQVVGSVLIEIFREHVYPNPNPPDVQLLVGVSTESDGCALLATGETALHDVPTYYCIGIGTYLAQYIIDQLYFRQPVKDLKYLAIHAIDATKEYVEGCGKETAVRILRSDGTVTDVDQWQLKDAEEYFADLSDVTRLLLRYLADSNDPAEVEMVTEYLRHQTAAFRDKQKKREEQEKQRRADWERFIQLQTKGTEPPPAPEGCQNQSGFGMLGGMAKYL